MPDTTEGPRRRTPLAAAGVGLALLAAGGVYATSHGSTDSSYQPHPASATSVPFVLGVQGPPVFATPDLPPAVVVRDPAAAVTASLSAARAGRTADVAALLPDADRRRVGTLAALGQHLADTPVTITATVLGTNADPTGTGEVDVRVRVTRSPSLDPVRGLVAATALETYRAVPARTGGFRVPLEPLESRAVLPPASGAVQSAQAWVAASAHCDAAAADRLVVDRLGETSLFDAPCTARGTWTAGQPLTYDDVDGTAALLDRYGPDVRQWARFVPVASVGAAPLLVALAPIGTDWRVVAVLPDPAAG